MATAENEVSWLITWKLLFSGEEALTFCERSTRGFFQMGVDDEIYETYCSETYSSEPTKFT